MSISAFLRRQDSTARLDGKLSGRGYYAKSSNARSVAQPDVANAILTMDKNGDGDMPPFAESCAKFGDFRIFLDF
jgi:hypothetical protein